MGSYLCSYLNSDFAWCLMSLPTLLHRISASSNIHGALTMHNALGAVSTVLMLWGVVSIHLLCTRHGVLWKPTDPVPTF